jgi:hypothetical protein
VFAGDALDEEAGSAVAGFQGGAAASAVEGISEGGEREAAGALLLTVADDAALGEDGVDLAVEVDAFRCGRRNGEGEKSSEKSDGSKEHR